MILDNDGIEVQLIYWRTHRFDEEISEIEEDNIDRVNILDDNYQQIWRMDRRSKRKDQSILLLL